MRFVFRWLVRITSGLVLLALAAVVLVYFLASQSLPDYDQTVEVKGLTAPIEIIRDTANVPHILSENDPDVFFGLGYAHAQDRLWQMTVMRRTAQGRLSEVFGKRTVHIDKLLRRLDLYGLAHRSVDVQDDYTKAALRAYAAGVNARLDEINEAAGPWRARNVPVQRPCFPMAARRQHCSYQTDEPAIVRPSGG